MKKKKKEEEEERGKVFFFLGSGPQSVAFTRVIMSRDVQVSKGDNISGQCEPDIFAMVKEYGRTIWGNAGIVRSS